MAEESGEVRGYDIDDVMALAPAAEYDGVSAG